MSPGSTNSKASLAAFTRRTCPDKPIDRALPVPPCDRASVSPVWNSASPVATLLESNTTLTGVLSAIYIFNLIKIERQ